MINLMYIVLTAMLALNVSSDVLNGFKQVEDGLERSTSNASLQNDVLYQKLADFNSQNPEKGGPWYKKSLEVKKQTALLYDYIDSLKNVIVKKADGKDGDVNNIEHQDVSSICFSSEYLSLTIFRLCSPIFCLILSSVRI